MTELIRWTDLVLRDSDGTDAKRITKPNGESAHVAGLREFRKTSSIDGLFFERLGRAHEDAEDASTWGPGSPEQVDWTGFDAGTAVMVNVSHGTYEIPGAAEIEDWMDVRTAVLGEGAEIEAGEPLTGWGQYTRVYRITYPDGGTLTYFVAE